MRRRLRWLPLALALLAAHGASAATRPPTFVLLGGSGDLGVRMLLPSLMELRESGRLAAGSQILVVDLPSASTTSDEAFREQLRARVRAVMGPRFREDTWSALAPSLHVQPMSLGNRADGATLRARVDDLDGSQAATRIFYFAIPDKVVPGALETLAAGHLLDRGDGVPPARAVVEKPIGSDEASARALNDLFERYFGEDRTYRIDHYMGKTGVDNLLALRDQEAFRRVWNKRYIDHVAVSAFEQLGVGARADFYERTGAMRDMVQSHLLQLLALALMPASPHMGPAALRKAKLAILRSLPTEPRTIKLIRGQYRAGAELPDYRAEHGVAAGSTTETFAALRARLTSSPWKNLPVSLATGKALAAKSAELLVHFRRLSPELAAAIGRADPNAPATLRIGLAPDTVTLDGTTLNVGARPDTPSSHARLLTDVIAGDQSRFLGRGEVEAAWRFIDAARRNPGRLYRYRAGSAGPNRARAWARPTARSRSR
jgi:glucose-6-phosphate 1-dehydrogenase